MLSNNFYYFFLNKIYIREYNTTRIVCAAPSAVEKQIATSICEVGRTGVGEVGYLEGEGG
jgi:hypothetical protein